MPWLVMPGIGRRITRMVISNGLELARKRMTVIYGLLKSGCGAALENRKLGALGNRGGSPLLQAPPTSSTNRAFVCPYNCKSVH
jgi:hypothetical protein